MKDLVKVRVIYSHWEKPKDLYLNFLRGINLEIDWVKDWEITIEMEILKN